MNMIDQQRIYSRHFILYPPVLMKKHSGNYRSK